MIHLLLTILLTCSIIFFVLQVFSWRIATKRKQLASHHVYQWPRQRSID